jgi:hypothetical protein
VEHSVASILSLMSYISLSMQVMSADMSPAVCDRLDHVMYCRVMMNAVFERKQTCDEKRCAAVDQ